MDIVTDLVMAPFSEIVEKAAVAQQNAEEDKSMLAESQKLGRGAERILKALVPLCTRLHSEYGANFIDELKQHDEIARYRLELNNLLWDFEDYMEAETYEKGPYTDLQALCKNAGLGIGEILKRMKIKPLAEPQTEDDASRRASAAAAPISRETHPGQTATPFQSSTSPKSEITNSKLPVLDVPPTPSSVGPAGLEGATSPDQAQPVTADAREHEEEEERLGTPPSPPAADPWDIAAPSSLDMSLAAPEHGEIQRRPPVSPGGSDAISPSSPEADTRYVLGTSPRRLDVGVMIMEAEERRRRAVGSDASPTDPRKPPPQTEAPNVDTSRRSTAPGSPPAALNPLTHQILQPRDGPTTFAATILPSRGHRDSQASSLMSRESMQSSVSPAAAGSRGSMQSMPEDPDPVTGVTADHRPLYSRTPTIPPNFPEGIHEGIEAVPREYADGEGLIPVGTESPDWPLSSTARTTPLPPRDCTMGLTSSFFQYKGFCEGAKETARGGSGVKKVKKPGFAGPQSVAKCAYCDFESDMHHLEMDQKQSESENFVCAGVGYRVRFLQKSHVATRRSDEELYGCVFCAHVQRTVEECDATVFFSPRKLFEHLARHPRPLPPVPGFTVIEGAEVPLNLRNNYDLRFMRPVAASPLDDVREETASMPVATAIKAVRKMHGMRLLHDQTPAFELAAGARLTGIEFPSKYQGEWALGWHDGAKKSVPFDLIRLDPPPKNEVRVGGTTAVVAVARWRHAPKAKDDNEWLRFDKGEVISNIRWAHAGHWCWSGSNSKGKWGIFPQQFIDTNTVREVTASDQASIVSNEQRKFRFSISRKGGIRPPSFSGQSGGRVG